MTRVARPKMLVARSIWLLACDGTVGVLPSRGVGHWLFSYGTLGQPEVQRALFGEVVPTVDDELPGHRLDWVAITDSRVVAISGSDRHPIVRPGSTGDSVAGRCLHLDDAQLGAADAYEVEDYQRCPVTLTSGRRAWVYLAAQTLSGGEELGEP